MNAVSSQLGRFHASHAAHPNECGFTLIELVIAIVVVAICVVSVLGLLGGLAVRSANAGLRTQATSIAASYLDLVLSEPFATVNAYNALDHVGARDRNGAPIAGLAQYRVQIAVSADVLNPGPNQIAARRIDVTVTDPVGARVVLTGYRANTGAAQVLR